MAKEASTGRWWLNKEALFKSHFHFDRSMDPTKEAYSSSVASASVDDEDGSDGQMDIRMKCCCSSTWHKSDGGGGREAVSPLCLFACTVRVYATVI